jgi:hypothetical protein
MEEKMNDGNRNTASKLSPPGFVAALLVLAGFAALIAVMILQTGVEEKTWTRLAWIFSSVEAIAFAAAGALFGASVHRERAERAERRAETNERTAANGRALAANMIAEDPGTAGSRPGVESLGPPTRSPGTEIAARHAAAARMLFPDLAPRETREP